MPETLRIFAVEDHERTLKYLRLYLEQLGHAVVTARTKAEALALLPSAEWDLFLCDIWLPDGDGRELLVEARLPATVYTVAMSGFGNDEDVARSHAAGYRRHILKPYGPEQLQEILAEAVLERRAARG